MIFPSIGLTAATVLSLAKVNNAQVLAETPDNSIKANAPNKISFALTLDYEYIASQQNTSETPNWQQYSKAGVQVQMDACTQLAVWEINNRTDILPQTYINLVRYEDLIQGNFYVGSQAADNLYEVAMNDASVVGVVGGWTSSSTRLSAEVAGELQLPYCGTIQTNARFSNKENYPYMFRTTSTSASDGMELSLLLLQWKIKNIAILWTYNPIAETATQKIRNTVTKNGVNVVEYIAIQGQTKKDYDYYFQRLIASDARYIYVNADQGQLADIYFTARKYGLVNSNYVWISTNFPVPYSGDYDEYGVGAKADIQGFIYMNVGYQLQSSPNGQEFSQKYNALNKMFPNYFILDPISEYNPESMYGLECGGMYDCVYAMAMGMDQTIKANGLSEADLAARKLGSYFNYTAFQNTGFSGLSSETIMFNENGDLILPFTFSYADVDGNLWAFYQFNKDSLLPDVIESYKLQIRNNTIFYNGSTVLPPDSKIKPDMSVDLSNKSGMTIIVLEAIGIFLCVISHIYLVATRHKRRTLSAAPLFQHLTIVGLNMTFISGSFFIGTPTVVGCNLRMWLQVLGSAIAISSIIVKFGRIVAIMMQKTRVKKSQFAESRVFAVAMMLVVLSAGILIAWTLYAKPDVFLIFDSENIAYTCRARANKFGTNEGGNAITAFLFIYHLSLLLFATWVTRRVKLNERHHYEASQDLAFNQIAVMVTLALSACLLPVFYLTESDSFISPRNVQRAAVIRYVGVWFCSALTLLLIVGVKMVMDLFDAIEGNVESRTKSMTDSETSSTSKTSSAHKSSKKASKKAPKPLVEQMRNVMQELLPLQEGVLFVPLPMVCYKPDGLLEKWSNADASLHATSLRAWISLTSSKTSFSLPIIPEMARVSKSGHRVVFNTGIPDSQNLTIEGHTPEGVAQLYDDFSKALTNLINMTSESAAANNRDGGSPHSQAPSSSSPTKPLLQ